MSIKGLPIFTSGLVSKLQKIWTHLGKKNRRAFFSLLCLMLLTSFLEVIGIGAVIPFLGVITNTGSTLAIIENFLPLKMGALFSADPILWITLFFVLATILAAASRIFLLKKSTTLAFAVGAKFSVEIYDRTLHQPYEVHISRNSSEIVDGVISKVNMVAYSVLMPAVALISSSLLIVITTLVLFLFEPGVALVIFGGFGIVYVGLALFTKRRLEINSSKISISSEKLVQVLQEGLHGIRDVLLDGSQKEYCGRYEKVDAQLRSAQATNQFISQSPRFIIEAIGMTVIALVAYFLNTNNAGGVGSVAILGTFALGIQRLLPAMQQAYVSWTSLKGNEVALEGILELLNQPRLGFEMQPTNPINFDSKIELRHVKYRYHPSSRWILNGVNLMIAKGSRVGFVGKTGCGKSTLLDLIMGLLRPTGGSITVDGLDINSPMLIKGWQKRIAHVPQFIYLTDKTVAENIALGVPIEDIDMEKVVEVAEAAQMTGFVSLLPDGFLTTVGERGVKLSGGQRQRLGIARALYRDADVLILDEATSALDHETEIAVIEAISSLNSGYTILMIAHRLSTLEGCDQVYQVMDGAIKKDD